MPKENEEGITRLKIKILTILVILLISWQVIDYLRTNIMNSRLNNVASQWSVDSLDDRMKDLQRDVQDVKNDLWKKAEQSTVNNQIDDVYDYVREYCRSW